MIHYGLNMHVCPVGVLPCDIINPDGIISSNLPCKGNLCVEYLIHAEFI